MPWKCNVANCGNGQCVHEITDEKCPHCGMVMIRVKTTGFKFCSNPDYMYSCDYESEADMVKPISGKIKAKP